MGSVHILFAPTWSSNDTEASSQCITSQHVGYHRSVTRAKARQRKHRDTVTAIRRSPRQNSERKQDLYFQEMISQFSLVPTSPRSNNPDSDPEKIQGSWSQFQTKTRSVLLDETTIQPCSHVTAEQTFWHSDGNPRQIQEYPGHNSERKQDLCLQKMISQYSLVPTSPQSKHPGIHVTIPNENRICASRRWYHNPALFPSH